LPIFASLKHQALGIIMSQQLYDIRISQIRTETSHAKVISFDIPPHLLEQFRFEPGQYITLEADVNGKKVRRSYSICSYRNEPLSIGVKKVDGGVMSSYLNDYAVVGQMLKVLPPLGKFTVDAQPFKQKHYVLFAGGSGITPMLAITKALLTDEPSSNITLLYANRNEEHIMFRELFDSYSLQQPSRFKVAYTLDAPIENWNGYTGKFSKERATEMLDAYVSDAINVHYYICGPSPMMELIENLLMQRGVNIERIHKEFFTSHSHTEPGIAGGHTESTNNAMKVSDTPLKTASLTFQLDGSEYTVDYRGEDSILEAALDGGIDAPYACQIGACCTCRAKVTEGQVIMADRESLSDSEIEEGYVLTCQSKPLTERVVYSYDA
jgi:ring-1,2-phenylacetyl-CoA epoxidase subunit PaaE